MATKKRATTGTKKTKRNPILPKTAGSKISKATKVAGRKVGGALRAAQARQQKRRDSR